MKKKLLIFISLLLVAAMVVPAFAVTPKFEYKAVKLPKIKVSIKIPDSVFENWFKEHPIDLPAINISYTQPTLG